MHSMLKLGIITTIADAADSIDAFIYYHRQIGFERFYIFIDDNDQDTFNRIKGYPFVQVFLRDEKLHSLWDRYTDNLEQRKLPLIDKEVMVRQELNFYCGFTLAKQESIDWVLHLDIDELFYPNDNNVLDYFAKLQLSDIRAVTYLNYESISTQIDSKNIYESSSYFKVNYLKYKYWFYNKQQKDFLQSNSWIKEKFFLYYQNGKSSVNTYGKKITFYDVHSIAGDGARKMGGHDDPIILHYPCARLSDFIKKYQRLGNFADVWMGFPRAGDYIGTLHLEARDFICDKSNPDYEAFYRTHFLLNQDRIDQLCQLNLAKLITFPGDVLKKFS